MSEPRELRLPAPWAAGVVLGLIRVVPRPQRLDWHGPLVLVQEPGQDVAHAMMCLAERARLRGKDLHGTWPAALFVERGRLGTAYATGCVDLLDPRCGYAYPDHFFLGERCPWRLPWGLIIAGPSLDWAGKALPACPPRAPGQAGLFGGVS